MNNCQNPECSNLTKNPKFCSKSCSATMSNKNTPKRKPSIRTCNICKLSYSCVYKGKNLHKSRNICQSCRFNLNDIPNRSIKYYLDLPSIKNKHPSWKSAHIRGLARSWHRELLKLPCFICGYKKHVELAHIKPISSFPETALLKEVNHKSNVVQLCPTCHWEFDNGQMDNPNILSC